MQHSSDILISDTSCLILLSKIDKVDLLQSVGLRVYITPAIAKEYGKELPSWIKIKEPANIHYCKILEIDVDAGEASAIALSLEMKNAILIIDDLKGRKLADKLGLKYSGTFGLILRAKKSGVIPSVKPILEKVKSTDFRFSDDLFDYTLKEAGEKKDDIS